MARYRDDSVGTSFRANHGIERPAVCMQALIAAAVHPRRSTDPRNMNRIIRTTCAALMLLLLSPIVHSETPESSSERETLSMDDLARQQITQFVGRAILLRTRFHWEYADTKLPEDPTPAEELQKMIAGQLEPLFENYNFHVQRNEFKDEPSRGRFRIVSKHLTRKRDAQGVEQFVFKDKTLSRGKTEYILRGRLRYRKEMNFDASSAERVKDQSNNPVYWSQTFEFALDAIE